MTLIVFDKHEQNFKYSCPIFFSVIIMTGVKLRWPFFRIRSLYALVFSFSLLLDAWKGPSLYISCCLDWRPLHQLMPFEVFDNIFEQIIFEQIHQALFSFHWLFMENSLVHGACYSLAIYFVLFDHPCIPLSAMMQLNF